MKFNKKVTIIGLGRMGVEIAKSIPSGFKLKFIEINPTNEVYNLSISINANIEDHLYNITDTDIIILAVNPSQIDPIINTIKFEFAKRCHLINVATSKNVVINNNLIEVINVKIVGVAEEIKKKNKPAVIVPPDINLYSFNLVESLFSEFGYIIQDNISKYETLNSYIAEKVICGILQLKKDIMDDISNTNIDPKIIDIAIKNTFKGTLLEYPWLHQDEFIIKIFNKIKLKNNDFKV